MTRERPPDHLPPGVLSRSDFADACLNHDLGAMLNIASKWGGTAFTPSHLARRCEMTVSRVLEYMKGTREAQSIHIFERVSDNLHIPGHMLAISQRPWEDSATGVDVLSGGANLARHSIEVLRRNLDAAISEGAMNDCQVQEWEQTALQYGYATRDHTPDALITDLAVDLGELTRSLTECKSASTLRRITKVSAQMAGLMMLTFVKLDERQAFRRWARTARMAADDIMDREVSSWVRAQEAYGHYYSGNLIEAIEVARRAQDIADGSPCVGYVLAAALEARAHASVGPERRREVKETLDRAETILARLDSGAIIPSAFGYNEEQLRFHESSALTRLHDTKAAWKAQERALELCPASDYTDRTLIQLDRAACLVQDHDISTAMDCATRAVMSITEQQRRGIILLRAKEIADTIPSTYQTLPAVRDFRDLLEISSGTGELL